MASKHAANISWMMYSFLASWNNMHHPAAIIPLVWGSVKEGESSPSREIRLTSSDVYLRSNSLTYGIVFRGKWYMNCVPSHSLWQHSLADSSSFWRQFSIQPSALNSIQLDPCSALRSSMHSKCSATSTYVAYSMHLSSYFIVGFCQKILTEIRNQFLPSSKIQVTQTKKRKRNTAFIMNAVCIQKACSHTSSYLVLWSQTLIRLKKPDVVCCCV